LAGWWFFIVSSKKFELLQYSSLLAMLHRRSSTQARSFREAPRQQYCTVL